MFIFEAINIVFDDCHQTILYILILVVLGYDEIFAILRSPILLFFLVITVGGVYVCHQLGLIGPIKTVLLGLFQQILQQCSGHPVSSNYGVDMVL